MVETEFTPFPILSTDRLVLRQLEAIDDKDIFSHRSDERVNTYLDDFRHSSLEQTQAFITRIQNEIADGKTILWVITERNKNKFIGTICLWNISEHEHKAETGYTLEPEFHKMGYMNEALAKIIDFGFNKMKLRTIEAYTRKDNESSIRLLLKNKFKLDTTRKAAKEKGNDRIIFTLISPG
jgi:ribosomal-protein-alanine N-acetyltransferase